MTRKKLGVVVALVLLAELAVVLLGTLVMPVRAEKKPVPVTIDNVESVLGPEAGVFPCSQVIPGFSGSYWANQAKDELVVVCRAQRPSPAG